MLSLKDCMDYLETTEEIVEQIAHHEHIPMICAIEECSELLQTKEGVEVIKNILIDNIKESQLKHNGREEECLVAYNIFIKEYH